MNWKLEAEDDDCEVDDMKMNVFRVLISEFEGMVLGEKRVQNESVGIFGQVTA